MTRPHRSTGVRYAGAAHHSSKLTEAQAESILRAYPAHSIQTLAGEYEVEESTIRRVIQGETWKHVYRRVRG